VIERTSDAAILSPTPSIETDRLELVPLHPGHAAEMVAVLADPALYAFTGGSAPGLVDLEERYAAWERGAPRPGEAWHNWVIRLGAGGPAIGHLQATIVSHGLDDAAADIAWLIGTPWQGRGFAGEAARALVRWLQSIGVWTITAHIAVGHAASERVARAAGLAPTPDMEDGEVVWRRRE
jgi:RimJ/RimL family protein N-acetyltransferase